MNNRDYVALLFFFLGFGLVICGAISKSESSLTQGTIYLVGASILFYGGAE